MGLNVKDIQLHVYRVVHDSTKSSYTFLQRHPLFSGVSLVCVIIYVFLSYIYNFLVYMSPFLVCGVIFIRIFWSSEKTHLRYVKSKEERGEKKKVEPKYPKIPRNGRHVMLDKSQSQNAISRRRIFSERKWDVYGGLGEKAKDLSAVFHNEFTKRNTQNKEGKSFEKGENSLYRTQVPKRQTLRSEPSMVDLVECGDLERKTKIENGDDEDGDEAQEDRNKAIEWTKDDQENLMYLGISEMERNRRLMSLIAKRRASKSFKGQLEKATNDKNSMAPVLNKRSNPSHFSKEFEDGLEIPGSAPSLLPRSPYVIPPYPSEEKSNLTGDGLIQEFCSQKDMPFCRHESFSLGHPSSETKQGHGTREHYTFNSGRKYSDKPPYSRFRRTNTDKGTHDWLIDQLIYSQVALNPLEKEKDTAYEEDRKYETDVANMEDEKIENDHEKISMSDNVSELDSVPKISNFGSVGVSERSGQGPRFPKPKMRLLNIPLPITTTVTNINEAMYDTVTSIVDKREESMLLVHGRLCHTPTHSVASDLQVELSEIGSPTSQHDENVETNSSTDTDSTLYDGDIDKGVSSGSEELWGASFHGTKEAQGVKGEGDDVEVNNSNDVASSTFAPQHMDEENTAGVNSISSKSDVPEGTLTHHAVNNHDNIFDHTRYHEGETEVAQSSNYSHPLDQLPYETHSEKVQEWCNNLPANGTNEAQVINDENNSVSIEQDNIETSRSNEDHGTSVMRQESVDETSTYSVSSSPRSVLPEKTMEDDVSLSGFDQHMNIDAQQTIMDGMAQETSNNESPPDTMMPQTIQPFMDDTIDESHNIGFNNSQEQANSLDNDIEKSNISDNMNDEEIHNNEEQDKSMNKNNENNSYHLNREEASAESSTSISEITTSEDMDAKSRDLSDDKVPRTELTKDDKNDKSSSSNVRDDELSK